MANKVYKSKISPGITLFLVIVLGGVSALMIIGRIWVGLAFNLLIAGFVVYVMTGFSYTIDGVNLIIKGGFRWKANIDIKTIAKIVETNNPISSPAASLDRLAIHYNGRNAVMISPKDKKSFVEDLLKINPAIEVKWKILKKF